MRGDTGMFGRFEPPGIVLRTTLKIDLSKPVILSVAKDLKILHFVQNDITQIDFHFSVKELSKSMIKNCLNL